LSEAKGLGSFAALRMTLTWVGTLGEAKGFRSFAALRMTLMLSVTLMLMVRLMLRRALGIWAVRWIAVIIYLKGAS